MANNNINSISEFLLHAGTEYRVFDMGRGLKPIDTQMFLSLENGTKVAPYPRQKHAWFGIVFWNKRASEQHYIWFLKLPIDEQGLIVSATRNHFLQIIVDALGQSIADDSESAKSLPDNPYSFVPPQNQMAQFNAYVKQQLNGTIASQNSKAVAYMRSPQVVNWQTLSIQDVANIAVQLNDVNMAKLVASNFTNFAPAFQKTLMRASEGLSKPNLVLDTFESVLFENNTLNIEALSGMGIDVFNQKIHDKLIEVLNGDDALRVDVLSVIAARHFTQMDNDLILAFFEAAARADAHHQHNGALFGGLFADLVQLPSIRQSVLSMLRTTNRSETLAQAIGLLFSQTRTPQ